MKLRDTDTPAYLADAKDTTFVVHLAGIAGHLHRPVGWSRDGGVRERMRVELTSGGGAFPAWGMGGAL